MLDIVMSNRTIAFDIGIKNLAYCVLDGSGSIVALENANIMPPAPPPPTCRKCKFKAVYQDSEGLCCKRHANKPLLALPDQKPFTEIPTLGVLRQILALNSLPKASNKDSAIASILTKFAIPYKGIKEASAAKLSLDMIHDGIRKFVYERWNLFSKATNILLENQPVYKNPHMKSVQVLLYATLRENALRESKLTKFHLVHAKKKVMDAEAGDAGYAERKAKSEDRVKELFSSGTISGKDAETHWLSAKKKSDMADAVCMCVDFVNSN
jgi:hypothetical protein